MGMFDYVYLDFNISTDFLPECLMELPKNEWQTKSLDRKFNLYIVSKDGGLYNYPGLSQKESLHLYANFADQKDRLNLTKTLSIHNIIEKKNQRLWIDIDLDYVDGKLTTYNIKKINKI